MKAVFLTSILALALFYAPPPAVLAQAEQDTPESVAKAYVAAFQVADWTKAASFMHPDSLTQFKELFAPIFANEKAAKGMGMLLGINSRAEFDQVSGAQIFEKLLTGLGGAIPGLNKAMGEMSFDIIGHIAETPDMVHLVYRAKASMDDIRLKEAPSATRNVTLTKMEVMTLKRYENTWRVTLSSEIEGMGQMFANIFAETSAAPDEQKSSAAPGKAPSTRTKARKPARRP